MRVRDESEFHLLLAELASDTSEVAGPFWRFFTTWAEMAEAHLSLVGPAEALRRTLRHAEDETDHFSAGFLGMCLVLFYNHWDFDGEPDVLYNSLTPIEQHLFEDVAALKMLDLQKQAAQEGASE